jgi:hypothetical protein
MEGRGDDPVTFQKKSSLLGVSPVNAWLVWPAYFLGKKRAEMQCCFLKSARSHFALMMQISNRNRQITLAVLIP